MGAYGSYWWWINIQYLYSFWLPDGVNGADEYESVSDILLQAVTMKHKDLRHQFYEKYQFILIWRKKYCDRELVHALDCSNYPDASSKLRGMPMLHLNWVDWVWHIFQKRLFCLLMTRMRLLSQSLFSVILSCLLSHFDGVIRPYLVYIYLCQKYTIWKSLLEVNHFYLCSW